jgi:cytochrome c553
MIMTQLKRTIIALAATLAIGVAVPVHAANVAAGQAKAKEVCAACHGADGNSPQPDYPKLAGQYRDYLEKALHDYKSGQRKNPIMAANAAALSNDDIANLAAWFSSQPAAVTTRY